MNERLEEIRDASVQVFDPSQYAAPASMCQTFANGAIGARFPNFAAWKNGYDKDPEMSLIRDMINMSSNVTKVNLLKVNYNYRGPLRQSLMVIENNMIVICEPLGWGSNCYTKL